MELDATTPGYVMQTVEWVWWYLKPIVESNFFTALLGAGAGALAAYLLARKAKRFDDNVQEVRYCNEGLIAAWNLCNSAMVLRKQHVKALKDNFDSSARQAEAHRHAVKNGAIPAGQPYVFIADYRKLPPFFASSANLQRACDNITLGGKSLMMANSLMQSIEQLNLQISEHNITLQNFEATSEIDDDQKVARHFGLLFGGKIDTRYRDTVKGIAESTDDCIWFAARLADAFTVRGKEVKGKNKRMPKVQGVTFPEGSIPDDSNYADFL